jgi:glycosyltransferase involved in cell wall biosynthesis
MGFIGGARYSEPLGETDARKLAALKNFCDLFVLGFAKGVRPRCFVEGGHFYLLPNAPTPLLRYAEMAVFGPLVMSWLVWRHRVDVIVAQSPYTGAIAALVKQAAAWVGRELTIVIESHGDFEGAVFLYRRVWCGDLYRRVMRATSRFALRRADVLRGISNCTSAQLRRAGGCGRLVQFPAWTDLDVFFAAGARGTPRASGDILFAGTIAPIKGVHYLVRAFAALAEEVEEARLIIAGREVDSTYAARVRAEMSASWLTERIFFVGEVPQPRLAELMASCGVFVLPSLSEGLGRVVIEAMATGAPVVASRVGGVVEVITHGVTGWLVAAGEEETLRDGIRHALVNRPEAEAVGERARDWARGHLSGNSWRDGYARILAIAAELREERAGRDGTAK